MLSLFLNHLYRPTAVIPILTASIRVIFIPSVSLGINNVAKRIKLINIRIDAAIPIIFLPNKDSVSAFLKTAFTFGLS